MVFFRYKLKIEYNINILGFFFVIFNYVCCDVYVKFKWVYFLLWCYYKDLYLKLYYSSGLRRMYMLVLLFVFCWFCWLCELNYLCESYVLVIVWVFFLSIFIMRNLWNFRVKKSSESLIVYGIFLCLLF